MKSALSEDDFSLWMLLVSVATTVNQDCFSSGEVASLTVECSLLLEKLRKRFGDGFIV